MKLCAPPLAFAVLCPQGLARSPQLNSPRRLAFIISLASEPPSVVRTFQATNRMGDCDPKVPSDQEGILCLVSSYPYSSLCLEVLSIQFHGSSGFLAVQFHNLSQALPANRLRPMKPTVNRAFVGLLAGG